jgi:hypothetical protein
MENIKKLTKDPADQKKIQHLFTLVTSLHEKIEVGLWVYVMDATSFMKVNMRI